ncbi:hypothetical protein [Bacillus subtilis]
MNETVFENFDVTCKVYGSNNASLGSEIGSWGGYIVCEDCGASDSD